MPAHQVTRALELERTRRFTELVAERLVANVRSFFTLWEGDVDLPSSRPEGARFRLVVAEYEEYWSTTSVPTTQCRPEKTVVSSSSSMSS